jgi:hypothetical protein
VSVVLAETEITDGIDAKKNRDGLLCALTLHAALAPHYAKAEVLLETSLRGTSLRHEINWRPAYYPPADGDVKCGGTPSHDGWRRIAVALVELLFELGSRLLERYRGLQQFRMCNRLPGQNSISRPPGVPSRQKVRVLSGLAAIHVSPGSLENENGEHSGRHRGHRSHPTVFRRMNDRGGYRALKLRGIM